MTPAFAAVALVMLTVALLLEEWSWRRRQARLAARRMVPTVRCLVCPGGPVVEDFRTHSRLVHAPRVRAAEDHEEWGRRSA